MNASNSSMGMNMGTNSMRRNNSTRRNNSRNSGMNSMMSGGWAASTLSVPGGAAAAPAAPAMAAPPAAPAMAPAAPAAAGAAAAMKGGARKSTVGSKAQVWHGTAAKTVGGLTKKDLMKHKGRIVSRKKHALGKKAFKRLVKAGFKPKRGTFKLFRK